MAQADSSITTDLPVAPTASELEAMWQDLRDYERFRRSVNSVFAEKAAEDAALYGEAA